MINNQGKIYNFCTPEEFLSEIATASASKGVVKVSSLFLNGDLSLNFYFMI